MCSKNDYKVIITLYEHECTTEMKSFTIKKLHDITDLSVNKIRDTIKSFLLKGYIAEGAAQHNAKTYYITQLGIQKINNLFW